MSLLLVNRMSGVGKSQIRRVFRLLMTRTASSLSSPATYITNQKQRQESCMHLSRRFSSGKQVVIDVFTKFSGRDVIKKELGLNNIVISDELVLEVLTALKSVPGVAFKFFQWILDLHPNEISSKSYNAMLLIFGVNGNTEEFWSLVDTMRKKGFSVSGYVRDEVSETFQKDGLVCDVNRLKELFATEDILSRKVCRIVKKNAVKKNANMHKELKDLQLEFKSSTVKLVLERLSDFPEKALLFFHWVTEFGNFTHDEKTYNALAKILGRETSLGSFLKIFKEMKGAGYEMEWETYERGFHILFLDNMIEEAVELFEYAMVGRNKPTSDFNDLLNIIVTSGKLDMYLLSRTLKAYTRNGYTLSYTAQQFVLACLKQVGQGKQYEASELVYSKNLKGFRGQIVQETMSAGDKMDTVFVRNRVDAKAAGIKGSMIPTSAWIVLRALKWRGFESYLVGGCVRDLLLHRTPRDFDVVTTASLQQVEMFFTTASIVGKSYPICHVCIEESLIEVSTTKNISPDLALSGIPCGWEKMDLILYENSQKRDFTVNSMFLDPKCSTVFDYNSGIADLKNRMLRTVITADQSFNEDCARILRGVRIAARLDLSFSEETEIAIPKYIYSVASLNSSRLMREMHFLFSYGYAVASIKLLKKLKLLHVLLPYQAMYLEASENWGQCPEEEKAPFIFMMLMNLFSSMDKRHSCDNPASENAWISLLAFHVSLVLEPQPSVVVYAMASLLTFGKLEGDIDEAALTKFLPEFSDALGSDDFAELGSLVRVSEAVSGLGDLVREHSAHLVTLGEIYWVLNVYSRCVRGHSSFPKVFIEKAQWKRAANIFKVSKSPASRKKKAEIGIIILETIRSR